MIEVTRIYSDPNGDSHFQDIRIPLINSGEIGRLSDTYRASHISFRDVAPGYDFDFHNAPNRQFIILLDGKIEIETSLGEKRAFSSGEILLVEDTAGKGHKTKNLKKIRRKSIFIVIPDDVSIP